MLSKKPIAMVRELLRGLVKQKRLLELSDQLYLHPQNLDPLIGQVREYFDDQQTMTVADFKSLTGTSRKYAVPLLEYLDDLGVTIRQEDHSRTLAE